MISATDSADSPFGPWNPGIRSPLPRELRPLATIFRTDNVFTPLAYADELADLTGIDPTAIVVFRPRRLALHELLVRITADIAVPDGQKIEDLGINFREITRVVLARYIEPQMPSIAHAYDALRNEVSIRAGAELDALFAKRAAPVPRKPKGFLARLAHRPGPDTAQTGPDPWTHAVAGWQERAGATTSIAERAAYVALARVISALLARHGELWGSREIIASLATGIACNLAGSEVIGALIEPMVAAAAEREGYRLLPRQERPVVMNTKGPSASGKSTLRPLQRRLAGYLGVDWSEFALISPDIWRKQLIDYASLGAHYKYAGAFTGDELQIVDQKLDQYMARKASRGIVPHLLIDRFRFDSFAPDSDEAGSNLLTRFGHVVYLFFLITPPASIVERAWKRGLEVGRYKAVDDLLDHAVEAYSGMPQLFFTWIRRSDKRVHFEFLDNSVPFGELPRTVAFGRNETLNVLDVNCMLDIERHRRVNIDATSPEVLYRDPAVLAPAQNTGFLRQCVEQFGEVNFADRATGAVYLRIANGAPLWADEGLLANAATDAATRAGLVAVAPALFDRSLPSPGPRVFAGGDVTIHTVGAWGSQG